MLAAALQNSLLTSQSGEETPDPFQRRISSIAEQEAGTVREALSLASVRSNSSRHSGEASPGSPADPHPISWSTFLLPASLSALGVFPIATEIEGHADLCDKGTGRSAFSWVPPGYAGDAGDATKRVACLMRALRTDGDGNCLLHASGLATWGVHDRTKDGPLGPLRDQVAEKLRSEEFVSLYAVGSNPGRAATRR